MTGKTLLSYIISNVAKTDAGLYECVGSNKAGVGSKTEQFTVQCEYFTVLMICHMPCTVLFQLVLCDLFYYILVFVYAYVYIYLCV